MKQTDLANRGRVRLTVFRAVEKKKKSRRPVEEEEESPDAADLWCSPWLGWGKQCEGTEVSKNLQANGVVWST